MPVRRLFASLGIGHFIWYPAGKRGRFEESFPPLLQYLIANGLQVPGWLKSANVCPWPDRSQFLADQQSPRMKELRGVSNENRSAFQAKFAALRLERALPHLFGSGCNSESVKRYEKISTESLLNPMVRTPWSITSISKAKGRWRANAIAVKVGDYYRFSKK